MKEGLAVETTAKRVVKIANGQVTVLTEGTPDKPLMAPNDLVLDSKEGLYRLRMLSQGPNRLGK